MEMQSTLCNAQLWLGHAEQVRSLSKAVSDPRTKQQMLHVAAGFDRIANLASQLNSKSALGSGRDRRLLSRLWQSAA